ncbi:MAG: cadherin-like domain-containing protein, partial [Planctomyces sp.]
MRGTSEDGSTSTQSFTIALSNVNEAPKAQGAVFEARQLLGVTGAQGTLLIGSSDPENSTLTAVLVSGPFSGTVTINPDGSFAYVPTDMFYGVDSFTWCVTDGQLSSQPVTATIVVLMSTPGGARTGSGTGDNTGTGDNGTGTGTGGQNTDSRGGVTGNDSSSGNTQTPSSPIDPSSGSTTAPSPVQPQQTVVSDPTRLAIFVTPEDDAAINSLSGGWLVSIALDALPEPNRLAVRSGLAASLHYDGSDRTVWGGRLEWITPADTIVMPK